MLNRRSLICGAPAVGVALVIPAVAAEPEHPWVKARRLAKELAETLTEIEPEDRPARAIIWPSDGRRFVYGFENP